MSATDNAVRAGGQALAGVYGVEKRFAGVHAVKDVTIELRPGEVHCLIGENGAGKSTVVKMLAGVHRPDAGHVRVGGTEVKLRNPHDALSRGVSTVFQELTLVPEMTVAENVALGQEPLRGPGILNRARRRQWTRELLAELGVEEIRAGDKVKDLGIAQQQLVEIAKAVSREGERVVIMDEPTATLTTTETETLFALIRRLRARGLATLYITHRLEELEAIGDVVTVMRDGAVVFDGRVADSDRHRLIEAMVGRRIDDLFLRRDNPVGETVMEISGRREDEPAIVVRRGEVVGLFGLIGAGRSEMVRSVYGADPPDGRTLHLDGRPRRFRSPRAAIREGVAVVPEDRKGQGIVPLLPVATNIGLSALPAVSKAGVLSSRALPRLASEYVESLSIKTPSVRQHIANLSGGNQQKCLIARALAADPHAVVLDEPTRGVDVGARVEVYRLINRLCAEGRGVLMITSDLPEAIGMSDRIYVMRSGSVVGELGAREASQDAVMRLALGAEPPTAAAAEPPDRARARPDVGVPQPGGEADRA